MFFFTQAVLVPIQPYHYYENKSREAFLQKTKMIMNLDSGVNRDICNKEILITCRIQIEDGSKYKTNVKSKSGNNKKTDPQHYPPVGNVKSVKLLKLWSPGIMGPSKAPGTKNDNSPRALARKKG